MYLYRHVDCLNQKLQVNNRSFDKCGDFLVVTDSSLVIFSVEPNFRQVRRHNSSFSYVFSAPIASVG